MKNDEQIFATAQLTGPGQVILVVEDEAPIAETLALVLEENGYEPVLAANGQEALALLEERWPALVLTDLMMPRMDGVTFVGALRDAAAKAQRPAPPIIVMTAGALRHAHHLEVDAILAKPFDLDVLESLVARLLSASTATSSSA